MRLSILMLAAGILLAGAVCGFAGKMATGQTLYVPIYSSIHHGVKSNPIPLTCTLGIHNINPDRTIRVIAVDYYNHDGELVEEYLKGKKPIVIQPFATVEKIIAERDLRAGSGANFVVRWEADGKVLAPLVESVMISTMGGQGISFTSRAVVIEER